MYKLQKDYIIKKKQFQVENIWQDKHYVKEKQKIFLCTAPKKLDNNLLSN